MALAHLESQGQFVEVQLRTNSEMLVNFMGKGLKESGIIPELSHLDKSDTLWIIRFLQLQLEQMRAKENNLQEQEIDPMFGLNFLKSIHRGLPDFEDLKAEYFQDKYGIAL